MMELLVSYKILATENIGQVKICVNDWECKKVVDIKQTLQEVLHAPMCDQQIFYQGRLLDNNLTSLKNLYIRQGDKLDVHFVCKADLTEIQELLHDLKQFRMRICTNQDSLLKVTQEHFANDFFPVDYTDVTHALELLAFRLFAPWKTVRSLTNRRLFVQEGGFDVFTDIFKFSFKHYSSGFEEKNAKEETEADERFKSDMLFSFFCLLSSFFSLLPFFLASLLCFFAEGYIYYELKNKLYTSRKLISYPGDFLVDSRFLYLCLF